MRETNFKYPALNCRKGRRLPPKGSMDQWNDEELLKTTLEGMGLKVMDHWPYGIQRAFCEKNQERIMESLRGIPGLPKNTARIFMTLHEWTRRIHRPGPRIRHPQDAFTHLKPKIHPKKECFYTLSLNGAHEVISVNLVSMGTLNRTIVHPREIFHDLIFQQAAACIIAHNHPSGSLEPSKEDKEVTKRIRESGELLGIPVIDHIIFSQGGFYSFMEEGMPTNGKM